MDVQDFRTVEKDRTLEADLCIIGSGPAGLTLAREFAGTGVRVVLLESGGMQPDRDLDALNTIENVGVSRVIDQTLVRNRMLGGTSSTWSGRCALFDDVDFSKRAWVPHSGWPIERSTLLPFLARTAQHLGLTVLDNMQMDDLWGAVGRSRPDIEFDTTLLRSYFWSYSKHPGARDFMRFGPRALSERARGIRCFVNATLVHINTSPDGTTVEGLEVRGRDGAIRLVRARIVVLCAGGIENARLLLASNRSISAGIGNANDLVGRFLMDHPRGGIARFASVDHLTIQRLFGSYRAQIAGRSSSLTYGFALSPQVQANEGLLNCAAWISGERAPDDPWDAIANVARRRGPAFHQLYKAASGLGLLGNGLLRLREQRGPSHKLNSLDLVCMVEQRPNPDSRVTLAETTDAFGMPLSRIDWRVGDQEHDTVKWMAYIFCAEMRRLGFPVPEIADMARFDRQVPLTLPDVAHPTGTTRMSTHPRSGVVNTDLGVHGVCGLYVVGSSVFPTSGHANPTQTIVALAVRLADHLKAQFSERPVAQTKNTMNLKLGHIEDAKKSSVVCGSELRLVLVTGASGRLGSKLTEMLLDRGYRVRALTSKPLLGGRTVDGIEWRYHDWRENLDFTSHVIGCVAVLHLGAELDDPAQMSRVNGQATGALAEAAEAAGIRFMAYTSSISVYGSALTSQSLEDGPVLTADQDIAAEYWGNEALRTYGRTKLQGEKAIAAAAHAVEYVIFRPTVIVDIQDVMAVFHWGRARRVLLAYRNSHHIYVLDVVEAILWAMESALARDAPAPGITTYNLSDETLYDNTFSSLLAEAYKCLNPKPFGKVIELPGFVDWTKDYVRYKGFPPRRSLGLMSFPSGKLQAAGYRPVYGMKAVRQMAIKATANHQSVLTQA